MIYFFEIHERNDEKPIYDIYMQGYDPRIVGVVKGIADDTPITITIEPNPNIKPPEYDLVYPVAGFCSYAASLFYSLGGYIKRKILALVGERKQ